MYACRYEKGRQTDGRRWRATPPLIMSENKTYDSPPTPFEINKCCIFLLAWFMGQDEDGCA